jgi:hypothetical protein
MSELQASISDGCKLHEISNRIDLNLHMDFTNVAKPVRYIYIKIKFYQVLSRP